MSVRRLLRSGFGSWYEGQYLTVEQMALMANRPPLLERIYQWWLNFGDIPNDREHARMERRKAAAIEGLWADAIKEERDVIWQREFLAWIEWEKRENARAEFQDLLASLSLGKSTERPAAFDAEGKINNTRLFYEIYWMQHLKSFATDYRREKRHWQRWHDIDYKDIAEAERNLALPRRGRAFQRITRREARAFGVHRRAETLEQYEKAARGRLCQTGG